MFVEACGGRGLGCLIFGAGFAGIRSIRGTLFSMRGRHSKSKPTSLRTPFHVRSLLARIDSGSRSLLDSVMADPFEVRMRFTSQLQHLNASVNSSQKAAHYALKHRDMDEDLHSCILEQIERVCTSRSFLLH